MYVYNYFRHQMNHRYRVYYTVARPREHKIYVFEKPIHQKQKAGIVMSLNDTTLTKVTYGKYATQVPDEVAYRIYEWFSSQ